MDLFGIAMNLFHYYTYIKCFRSFDKFKLIISCIFLGAKIKGVFFQIERLQKIHKNYKNADIADTDIIYFELELMNFLGFELNIDTPYKYIDILIRNKEVFSVFRNTPFKAVITKDSNLDNIFFNDEALRVLCYNIVNDTYRRSLCVVFRSDLIAFAAFALCLALSTNYLQIENTDVNSVQVGDFKDIYSKVYKSNDNLEDFNICISEMVKLFNTKFKMVK